MKNAQPTVFELFLLRLAAARVAILFVFHALLFAACYAFAYLLRFDFAVPSDYLNTFKWSLPVVVGLQLTVGLLFGFYRGWWRYVGMADVMRLVSGLSVALAVLIG